MEIPLQITAKDFELTDVHITMTVPGGELAVKRVPNEDLYVSIRDAFNAARRKLEDFAREQRGDVKTHEGPPLAVIGKLFHDKDYGFLTTPDGLDIYFHAHSVINKAFKDLNVGMKVQFVEKEGEKGPQASTVTVI